MEDKISNANILKEDSSSDDVENKIHESELGEDEEDLPKTKIILIENYNSISEDINSPSIEKSNVEEVGNEFYPDVTLSYPKILKNSAISGFLCSGRIISFLLNNFLVGLILSKADEDVFAANSLIRSLQFSTFLLCSAPISAVGVLIGYDVKAMRSEDDITRLMQSGFILSGLCTFPAIILFPTTKYLLNALKQDPKVVDIVQSFFWIYLAAFPATLFRFNSFQIMNGLNKQKLAFLLDFTFIGLLAPGLTYFLALGKSGAPNLGIQGYAYSMLVAEWASQIGYQLILNLHKDFRAYQLYKLRGKYIETLKRLVKLGFPMILGFGGEVGSLLSVTLLAGSLGKEGLLVQNIVSLYLVVLASFPQAFFFSSSSLISRAIGQKNFSNVKRYLIGNSLLVSILPTLAIPLFSAIPEKTVSPFIEIESNNNTQAISILKSALPVMAVGELFDGLRLTFTGALYGMQDAIIPVLASGGFQLLIGIPVMYLLSHQTDLGVLGIFLALSATLMIIAAFTGYRFYQKNSELLTSSLAEQNYLGSKPLSNNKMIQSSTYNMSEKKEEVRNPSKSIKGLSTAVNIWGLFKDKSFGKQSEYESNKQEDKSISEMQEEKYMPNNPM